MSLIFFTSGLSACTPFSRWRQSQDETKIQTETALRPLVSNAFAYARYVAINLQPTSEKKEWSSENLRNALLAAAENSGVKPSEVLSVLSQSVVSNGESATFRRIALFERQHAACTSQLSHNAIRCCEALAWPMAILSEWSSLTADKQKALFDQARTADQAGRGREVFASWEFIQAGGDSGDNESKATNIMQDTGKMSKSAVDVSFRVQGLKAWLSTCHPIVTEQPSTLEQFLKSPWGRSDASHQWNVSLHPRSRAKRGPRRIHIRADRMVSYAETLKPTDCSVTETEVIVRRPDGALNFWVYDATGKRVSVSHFPEPNRPDQSYETIEKPTPDSCMGCHYNLITRHFDVMSPSAAELNLPETRSLPVVCQKQNEPVVEDN